MARHASNHSQSLPLLSASHPVQFCSFNGISSTRLRKYLTTEKKFLCCILRISKFLWTKRDVVLQQQTPFPEGVRRRLRSPLLREVAESSLLGQKKSPRIEWKYIWRKSTISTLIKQKERLQFLYVAIQTNYHCTSENFSLKTNREQTACLWQANTDNKRSYSLIF